MWVDYDNHPGIFLDYDEPVRCHVHTIVREPNGNDYGKDLLAQHYAKFHAWETPEERSCRSLVGFAWLRRSVDAGTG